MNIKIWFYRCVAGSKKNRREIVAEREFPGNVEAIELNSEYAAVLCEGKVHLQLIEADPRQYRDQDTQIFSENEGRITHMQLTETMLIYATDTGGRGGSHGGVKFFSLTDWTMLEGCEYRHDNAVVYVYPNRGGTRVCLIDNTGSGYIYNPSNSFILPISNFGGEDGSGGVSRILWDPVDWGTFVAGGGRTV